MPFNCLCLILPETRVLSRAARRLPELKPIGLPR